MKTNDSATASIQPKSTLDDVRRAMQAPLPGWPAQRKMAPLHRDMVISQATLDQARLSSVLVLLYPKQGELHFVLTLRADTLNKHKGQISLPGGSCDPGDLDFTDTALRETHEELGIALEGIQVLGALSPMYVPPSNFLIHPIVAVTPTQPYFSPNVGEVAAIIEVPMSDLLNTALISIQQRPATSMGGQLISVPTFYANGHYVWGATAMILAEFAELMQPTLSPERRHP